jgi:hypothetical protein
VVSLVCIWMEKLVETLAIVGGIVAAIVFVAERVAFAVICWMISRWLYNHGSRLWFQITLRCGPPLKRATEGVRRWWTMRTLRSQLAGGATP